MKLYEVLSRLQRGDCEVDWELRYEYGVEEVGWELKQEEEVEQVCV